MSASVGLLFNYSPLRQRGTTRRISCGIWNWSYRMCICANMKLLLVLSLKDPASTLDANTLTPESSRKKHLIKAQKNTMFAFTANCRHPWQIMQIKGPFLELTGILPDPISLPECHLCLAISTISWEGGLGFHYLLLFQWAIWPARTLTFLPDKTNQEQCLPSSIFISNTPPPRIISRWPCLPCWVKGSYSTDSLLSELVD